MLPEEQVVRPSATQSGQLLNTWRRPWFPVSLVQGWTPRWHDKVVQSLALYVIEFDGDQVCTVWTAVEDAAGKETVVVYVSWTGDVPPTALLERLIDGPFAPPETGGPIPVAAEPVLIRRPDGELVRLWPAPGPHLPKKQLLRVDWGEFWVLNRIFRMM